MLDKIIQLEKTLIGLLYVTNEIKAQIELSTTPAVPKLVLLKNDFTQRSLGDAKASGAIELHDNVNQL